MSLQYNYNKSGAERKALVQTISELLGQPAVYQGAPTFAYAIGGCSVDKNGMLTFADGTNPESAAQLVDALRERGYMPEDAEAIPTEGATEDTGEVSAAEAASETSPTEDANGTDTADTADASPENALVIELPKAGFTDGALDNLHKIVMNKGALLKKALGTDNLTVIDTGETLKFPWFTLHGLENEADAYSRLVTAICEMAKQRKRVLAKACGTENDKFTMRLFLVQLGFIGDEYKAARRLLLRNLTGNSSWKSGHAPERPASTAEAATVASDPEPENTLAETEGGVPDGK